MTALIGRNDLPTDDNAMETLHDFEDMYDDSIPVEIYTDVRYDYWTGPIDTCEYPAFFGGSGYDLNFSIEGARRIA